MKTQKETNEGMAIQAGDCGITVMQCNNQLSKNILFLFAPDENCAADKNIIAVFRVKLKIHIVSGVIHEAHAAQILDMLS